MALKILIVEDDLLYAERLKVILLKAKIVSMEDLVVFDNVKEVLLHCKKNLPDIIISDIYLSGQKTGIDLFEELAHQNISFVIITSSTDELLYEQTKRIAHINYLIKPVQPLTLISTIEKIIKEKEDTTINTVRSKYILVRNLNNIHVKVYFHEIIRIQSSGNYCTIFTENKKYTIKESITKLLNDLDERFIRCHQQYVINFDFVRNISPNSITVSTEEVPIGKTFRNQLTKYMNNKIN